MKKASETGFSPIQNCEASLVLSNSIEELADALKVKLFFSGGDPFDRRVVIVPHLSIKRFLEMRYAEDPDLGIAAGVEILPLSAALNELLPYRQPTLIELTLQIETQLLEVLREQSIEEKELLAPLSKYLANTEKERLNAFSQELAQLFLRYGRVGGTFLSKWKEEEGWQQLLWKRSFFPHAPWRPLSEALELATPPPFALNVFHFSALPEAILSFFNRCGASYFLFSPSALFWGDLCSSKERASLHRAFTRHRVKREEKTLFDQFLDEQNPLFANLAKVGRDFQNELLDLEIPTEERYLEKEEKNRTLLRQIQEELFNNKNEEGSRFLDSSIQIHAAANRLREVEILHDNLLKLVCDASMEAGEVLVLAPDISLYLPYIRMVFGTKEHFDFAVHDLPRTLETPCIQGIEHLLSLTPRPFDLPSVFALFFFPPFMQKFNLSKEDVVLFERWTQKVNIHGGGSWEEGFDRLLMGLAMVDPTSIDLTIEKDEVEKLALLIKLMRNLRRDLAPIIEERKMAVSFWLNHLEMLVQSYFTFELQEKVLIQEFQAIAESCEHLKEPLPFQSVIQILRKQLFQKKSGALQGSHLDLIHFGNLQEGVALPARAIYLLGMEEGAFPRSGRKHSLCALSSQVGVKPPVSHEAEDRYLFLQLMLVARDFFIVSFSNLSEEGKPLLPSLVVQELLSYLKLDLIKQYPALPSDPQNFKEGQSFSKLHFLAAKSAQERAAQKPFIETYYVHSPLRTTESRASFTASLKDLRKLAKNPLQFYFNKTADLELPWEEEETEFSLSKLVKSRLLKQGLREPIEPLLKIAEGRGALPQGAFGELAAQKLLEDAEETEKFFTNIPLSSDAFWEIEWKEGCKKPEEWKKGSWIVPALKVSLGGEREATIVGTLSDASTKGLIVHGKEGAADLLKAWPDLLLYALFLGKREIGVLWLKEQKQTNLAIDDPLFHLQNLLKYYEIARENASPLFPEWVEPLLWGTEDELDRKIHTWNKSGGRDPYREWLFWRDGPPSTSALFTNWTPTLRSLFADFPEL